MSSDSLKPFLSWSLVVLLAWATADCIDSLLARHWEPPLRAIPLPQPPPPPPVSPTSELERLLARSQSPRSPGRVAAGGVGKRAASGSGFPHSVSLQGVLAGVHGHGLCFLQVDGQARTLSPGDKIALNSEWMVASVESRRIILSHGRDKRTLNLGEALQKDIARPPAEPASTEPPPVFSTENWREIINKPAVLADLKAKPIIREGDMIGARLTIPPGHLIAKIGLQNQDILLSVNGHPVDKPGALAGLLPLIRNSHTLVFEVERQGAVEKVVLELD